MVPQPLRSKTSAVSPEVRRLAADESLILNSVLFIRVLLALVSFPAHILGATFVHPLNEATVAARTRHFGRGRSICGRTLGRLLGRAIPGREDRERSPPYHPDDSDEARQLSDWLFREAGCEGEGSTELGRCAETGARGLYATEAHGEGEYLVAVPMDVALVVEEEETTDAERGKKFLRLWDQLRCGGDVGETLSYGAYLDVLPTKDENFDPTPDFWDDESINALEFPRIVDGALARKRRLQNLADANEHIVFDELQFATWLVESRSFSVLKESERDDDDLQTACVLIPYLDMLNHSSDDPNAEIQVLTSNEDEWGEEISYYAVVATRDVNPGEEVTIAYGTGEDSSVELLLNYGFVPETNQFDVKMFDYGGDGCYISEGQWRTLLEEDDRQLQEEESMKGGVVKTVLRFRTRLKRALRAWKSGVACDTFK